MLDLTLAEATLFDDHAGMSWQQARERLTARICRRHRITFAGKPYAEIRDEIIDCADCRTAEMPSRVIGVLAWLARRRSDPDLDIDEYFERPIDSAWAELGEAIAAAAQAAVAALKRSTNDGDGASFPSSAA